MKCRNRRLSIYFTACISLVGLTISVPLRQVASQSQECDASKVSHQIKSDRLWSATDGRKLVAIVATRKHNRARRKFCPHDYFRESSRFCGSAVFQAARISEWLRVSLSRKRPRRCRQVPVYHMLMNLRHCEKNLHPTTAVVTSLTHNIPTAPAPPHKCLLKIPA